MSGLNSLIEQEYSVDVGTVKTIATCVFMTISVGKHILDSLSFAADCAITNFPKKLLNEKWIKYLCV